MRGEWAGQRRRASIVGWLNVAAAAAALIAQERGVAEVLGGLLLLSIFGQTQFTIKIVRKANERATRAEGWMVIGLLLNSL